MNLKVVPDTLKNITPILPGGFHAAGVHCGIKTKLSARDISLILTDRPTTAAGVYTTNQICAAPVVIDRQRTPSESIRAVITNSGNANACTGPSGMLDAIAMTEITGRACDISANEVLVMSTGIIGERLDVGKIEDGICAAAEALSGTPQALEAAAEGILTTDLVKKVVCCQLEIGNESVTITGIAKGSGMIAPNMATMLAVVMTDAKLSGPKAQEILSDVCERTFNSISVDGHTSTNDTVLLLASGAAEANANEGEENEAFRAAFEAVCQRLALAIVDDGEGATHSIEILVQGCASEKDASQIARTIGASPLVKTAIAGADPNWGRIVSAAGYAGPKFNPDDLSLKLNGTTLFDSGAPVAFDHKAVSKSLQENREIQIEVSISEGDCSAKFWTCDLTSEYVRINAEYHT